MTITPSLIYLVGIADQISEFISVSCIITLILIIGIIFFGAMYRDCADRGTDLTSVKNYQRYAVIVGVPVLVFLFLLKAFIPSTKTCYEMIIIPAAANSQLVQNIPQYIDDYLKQLTSDKSKSDD